MTIQADTITWFELPVTDMDRAMAFYSTVLGLELTREEGAPFEMSVFPGVNAEPGQPIVHGALMKGEWYVPGEQGPLIYFNGGENLAYPLGRVADAGGEVLQEKMSIGDHGFIAVFRDSEGNRVALHSPG